MLTEFAPALPWSGPAPSTTSVSLGATATTYGVPTTATVRVAADAAVTGTVAVELAGASVTGTLVGGTATVTLPATTPVGTHLVTATYAGSPTVAASVATATVKVTRAAPGVTATLVKAKVKEGVKARVRVVIGSTATSTVLVRDGRKVIRTRTVTGRKTITLPKLGVGKHRIRVDVVASEQYAAASSRTLTLKVVKRSRKKR